MILKRVHSLDILAYVMVPLFLVVFWLRSLTEVYIPESFGDITPMPLWGMMLKVIKGNLFTASLVVMILALLSAMGVNRFTNRYKLISKPTVLPGVIYILLISGFIEVQYIHPVWFFVPLFMLSIEKLFNAHGKHKPMAWCFDAAFWFSVGTLFFAKGMILFIFILIVMFIMRVFTAKTILASLFGLLLPYLFTFAYYLMLDKTDIFFQTLHVNFTSPVAFYSHTIYSRIYLYTMVFLVVISLINIARQMPTFKILTRKHYRVFNWLVIMSLLAAMTPFYSMEMIPVISIGSAIVIAYFLDVIRRNYVKELFFSAIILITILAQIFM